MLQKFFSGLQSQNTIYPSGHLQAIDLPANHSGIRETRCAEDGFDFLGKRILPIDVLPSQAALSRMQKNTVRRYEQGTSKQRVWKYWVLWLGWIFGTSFGVHVSAAPCVDIGFNAVGGACVCDNAGLDPSYAANWNVNVIPPYNGIFMNNNAVNVRYCANDTDTICTTNPPGSLSDGSTLYLKRVSDNTYYKCPIIYGSNPVSEYYTPTTSTPPSTPISASILDFNQPAVIFSKEIKVME
ncbi:hypothetical protein [Thioflexithrix psekupsensis]|uniref:Uncharacterized protein n=1 Tax=Thioflexithrix psekupsensis TaxID=1570016 RepID=A0A251X5V2_9GAMM|nr:hypothetical protein [Thioflexithrix psekupsensis]OUD13125.1 hypothetical protein TPSD3_10790 [Thioflexithrix psekupsensis]